MEGEIWKEIPNIPNYEISSYGNVRNKKTQRLNKLKVERYIRVGLYIDSKTPKWFLVHRLVGYAFLGTPNDNAVIDHIDRNKHNNKVENLRWTTQQQNLWNKTYKGYSIRPSGRYEVKIRDNTGKKIYIGTYDTEQEASEAYQIKVKEFRNF